MNMFQDKVIVITGGAGGIAALAHALAVSLAGKVRVNSISPGWIATAATLLQSYTSVSRFYGIPGYTDIWRSYPRKRSFPNKRKRDRFSCPVYSY